MTVQYLWLIVFSFALYFIVTDESIATAFYYVLNLIRSGIKREWWWLLNNPKNPIVKYLIYRRSMNMAKEIQKNFLKNKNE